MRTVKGKGKYERVSKWKEREDRKTVGKGWWEGIWDQQYMERKRIMRKSVKQKVKKMFSNYKTGGKWEQQEDSDAGSSSLLHSYLHTHNCKSTLTADTLTPYVHFQHICLFWQTYSTYGNPEGRETGEEKRGEGKRRRKRREVYYSQKSLLSQQRTGMDGDINSAQVP